jgi:hypothetical protein
VQVKRQAAWCGGRESGALRRKVARQAQCAQRKWRRVLL